MMVDAPYFFTGPPPSDDLPYVFASCDLFILPSSNDMFGNGVLEAQASGLPVIVTDTGGPKENMIPGKTGLVVKGNDPRSLLLAIQALLLDPDRRKEMSPGRPKVRGREVSDELPPPGLGGPRRKTTQHLRASSPDGLNEKNLPE